MMQPPAPRPTPAEPIPPGLKLSWRRDNRALPAMLVVVSLALAAVLLPFYGAILWGSILALLFSPLYRWLLPQLGQRRNTAALVTLLAALVMVVLPLALVSALLVQEAAVLYQQLLTGEIDPAKYFRGIFNALPEGITAVLDRFGLVSFNTLQRRLTAALTQGTQAIATQTFNAGQNAFEWVASLFIMIYLSFFLIRDGHALLRTVGKALPLAPDYQQALLAEFSTVVSATVKGNLLVALIQGALGGLGFWALGVAPALLWAVLMALLSLLPAVGAGLVWLPVALFFLLSGAVLKGLLLIAYGVLVIGLVDNLLRPILVGKATRLPDYLVMLSTLGGMAVFGINGFVLGPVIAAMFIAVWHIRASLAKHDLTH